MKMKFVLLTALAAMSQNAIAQSSSTTVAPAAAGAANTNVAADSTAAAQAADVTPVIKYLGIMRGPGLEFSGAHEATNNGSADMNLEHRVSFLAKTSEKFDIGVQARVNTLFGNGDSLHATAGNWRLMADIKHVYQNEIVDLTLIPRIMLPTSTGMRNQKLMPSPDLIADFAITPKNTRFSFDTGIEYIYGIYGTPTASADYQSANTGIVAPWLEVDYQLAAKTQLMVSYWPDYTAQARQNAPLHADSNEVDVGAYYDIAKGWQVNPYVATEMFGMDSANPTKNMQLNLIVTGKIL